MSEKSIKKAWQEADDLQKFAVLVYGGMLFVFAVTSAYIMGQIMAWLTLIKEAKP